MKDEDGNEITELVLKEPEKVSIEVTVDGESAGTVTDVKVNNTSEKIEIYGEGTVRVKVTIKGNKGNKIKQVDMNLNSTTEITVNADS